MSKFKNKYAQKKNSSASEFNKNSFKNVYLNEKAAQAYNLNKQSFELKTSFPGNSSLDDRDINDILQNHINESFTAQSPELDYEASSLLDKTHNSHDGDTENSSLQVEPSKSTGTAGMSFEVTDVSASPDLLSDYGENEESQDYLSDENNKITVSCDDMILNPHEKIKTDSYNEDLNSALLNVPMFNDLDVNEINDEDFIVKNEKGTFIYNIKTKDIDLEDGPDYIKELNSAIPDEKIQRPQESFELTGDNTYEIKSHERTSLKPKSLIRNGLSSFAPSKSSELENYDFKDFHLATDLEQSNSDPVTQSQSCPFTSHGTTQNIDAVSQEASAADVNFEQRDICSLNEQDSCQYATDPDTNTNIQNIQIQSETQSSLNNCTLSIADDTANQSIGTDDQVETKKEPVLSSDNLNIDYQNSLRENMTIISKNDTTRITELKKSPFEDTIKLKSEYETETLNAQNTAFCNTDNTTDDFCDSRSPGPCEKPDSDNATDRTYDDTLQAVSDEVSDHSDNDLKDDNIISMSVDDTHSSPKQGPEIQSATFGHYDKAIRESRLNNIKMASHNDSATLPMHLKSKLFVRQILASFFTHSILRVLFPQTALKLGAPFPASMPLPVILLSFIAVISATGVLTLTGSHSLAASTIFILTLLLSASSPYHGILNIVSVLSKKRADSIASATIVLVGALLYIYGYKTLYLVATPFEVIVLYTLSITVASTFASTIAYSLWQDPVDSFGSMSKTGLVISAILIIVPLYGILNIIVATSIIGTALFVRTLLDLIYHKIGFTASRSNVYATTFLIFLAVLLDCTVLGMHNEFFNHSFSAFVASLEIEKLCPHLFVIDSIK